MYPCKNCLLITNCSHTCNLLKPASLFKQNKCSDCGNINSFVTSKLTIKFITYDIYYKDGIKEFMPSNYSGDRTSTIIATIIGSITCMECRHEFFIECNSSQPKIYRSTEPATKIKMSNKTIMNLNDIRQNIEESLIKFKANGIERKIFYVQMSGMFTCI